MRLLLISLLVAGWLHAQQSSVAGVAVDQNGKPLAGVHIRLLTGDFDAGIQGDAAVFGAHSDEAGHFTFDGIQPGLYFVMAERTGFLQKSSGPVHTLAVKPGQKLTDYKITMVAQAVIQGHVSDEYGDPVQQVPVQNQAAEPKQRDFLFGEQSATTDDRGEFRLITAPGKFYLKASPFDRRGGQTEVRTDGTASGPVQATYFPSAADTAAASVVEVAPGQTVAGLDIRLLRSVPTAAIRAFTLSGSVIGIPETGTAMVALHCGDRADQLGAPHWTQTQPDGSFIVPGVRPGFCKATATYPSAKAPLQSRVVDLRVESDQTGVQLTLTPMEELIGKLEMVGDAPAGPAERFTVRLEPASWNAGFGQSQPAAAEVAADASFHIKGVPPEKFKPVVEPMPEDAYLKEVSIDGKPLPDRILDFTQGVAGSRLKLTVDRNGGQISGRILGKDGEPAVGMIMVLIGIDVKHLDEGNGARTTQGKYSFKALRPGKYRIVALDVAELMQAFTGDANEGEAMQKLFEAAEEIDIKEGDRISKDLTVINQVPEKKQEP
ncbi:MAG: carboxypeptidase-like regulatory domain-containing protein [Ignavibacteriota bacterium]